MATSVPDQAQVVQFARDLVNRAIKSSLEQVRGPVAWPLGEDFTAEAGRIAIEQLVAVSVFKPHAACTMHTVLLSLYRAGELVVAGGTVWTI